VNLNISNRPRILSGMRPTGRLHLGNLVGALQNWVKLQDEYDSFHFVADWHMLTTGYENTLDLRQDTWEMVADWLACGLDPAKATFFVQSRLPEHAELHLLFSMVTPLGWLERVPTYKEQLENIRDHDINTYGFLGYPLLQAADILMYKPRYVPVGEDQVPHVELTREVARRFNLAFGKLDLYPLAIKSAMRAYGCDEAAAIAKSTQKFREGSLDDRAAWLNDGLGTVTLFPEPDALLTSAPRLPGTDGRKMSKSYKNAIFLTDAPDIVSKKLATMVTDPARKRRTDTGNPDVCPVFDLHKIFSAQETIDRVNRECRTAEIGCVDCKKLAAGYLNTLLAPIQERRKPYEQKPELVWEILADGTAKARVVAQATMTEVRTAVKLTLPETTLVAERAARILPLEGLVLPKEYSYSSITLCVIDAVWSLGVNYSAVENVVKKYCEFAKLGQFRADRHTLPPRTEQDSVSDLCERVERAGFEESAATIFCNRQRTSSRGGVLKAEAVYHFAKVLAERGVQHLQDAAAILESPAEIEEQIRQIPGQHSGISFDYFLMLIGSEENVKPDRMIRRFLQEILGRDVEEADCLSLVAGASRELKTRYPHMTPRLLDYAIWSYQRERGGSK